MTARPLLLAAAVALGCAPRLLPGTDIRDTADTRAIATVLESYRQAMEKRDPQAVLALVAPDYFDNSGTPEPGDDVDAAGLAQRLDELSKVRTLRLQLGLRRLEVKGNDARAEIFFDQFYRVATSAGEVARHDADVHLMTLKRIGASWKFTGGL